MSKKIHVRPGKTESKIGFIVGLLFCLLGVVVVIPIFGIFGVIWTAIAGLITYSNYRNGFTDSPIDNHVIEIDEDGSDRTIVTHKKGIRQYLEIEDDTKSEDDVEMRLVKLQNLYHQGLITQEEYEQKKKEILDEL